MNKDINISCENFLEYKNDAEKIRRELHKIPELGFKEYKTQNYIMKFLENLGYQPKKMVGTGVYVYIKGSGELEETIAFRSDMDALNIDEPHGINFRSSEEGCMHACGHDGHMTMALLYAKYLKDRNLECPRNILLIFQPAEEGPGGAEPVLETGIFEKYKVVATFGFHLFPFIKEGVIATKAGPMMAMTSEFFVEINGKGGHAAEPETGVDAIVASAEFISLTQKIISRMVNPGNNVIISIGTINGGTRLNIIADKVILSGTIRSFNIDDQNFLKQKLKNIGKSIDMAYGSKILIQFDDMYPPLINDKKLFDSVWSLIKPEDKEIIEKIMLAEDFSIYGQKTPILFMGLGTYSEEKGFTENLHTSGFNFDETVLLKGLEIYVKISRNCKGYLNGGKDV